MRRFAADADLQKNKTGWKKFFYFNGEDAANSRKTIYFARVLYSK